MRFVDASRPAADVSQRTVNIPPPAVNVSLRNANASPPPRVHGWSPVPRAEPFHELWDAFRDLRAGIVAKVRAGFADVRVGQRHVAGLIGHFFDDRFLSQCTLDGGDEVVERGRLAFAEVEDFAGRAFVGKAREDALQDVVDVRVVPPRGAIAELLDGLAGVDAFCKEWMARSGRCRGP